MSNHRLPTGGRIDRTRTLHFTVDGTPYTGHPGDTLASALLAHGVRTVAPSLYRGRPRGFLAAGIEEPNALVRVRRPGDGIAESMLPATTVELVDGLAAEFLSGRGRLDPETDPALYDKAHDHPEVLVVGAGPTGLAAARDLTRAGVRVVLVDDGPELGGSLLSTPGASVDGMPAAEWITAVRAELDAAPDTTVFTRTNAFGLYDSGYVTALESRLDHLDGPTRDGLPGVSRQRLWHFRARHVVLATGAHERPLVFTDNDRPGIVLASALGAYLARYGVAVGREVVLATTNDSVYPLVPALRAAGLTVAAVVDSRPVPTAASTTASEAGVTVLHGHAVIAAHTTDHLPPPTPTAEAPSPLDTTGPSTGLLSGVTVTELDAAGRRTGETRVISCDTLGVSGGWSPVVHLHGQAQGRLRWDRDLAAFVPDGQVDERTVVGAARGLRETADCVTDGAWAAARARTAVRPSDEPTAAPTAPGDGGKGEQGTSGAEDVGAPVDAAPESADRPLWVVPGPDGDVTDMADADRQFVDLQRDQTVAEVLRATGAGMRSVEHVKRYTSISTANDQGKTSAVNAIGVIAAALGAVADGAVADGAGGDGAEGTSGAGSGTPPEPGDVGTTTFRAPYAPVPFVALAGRERGDLFDPIRVTAVHPWHEEHGAVYELVGQWLRPRYYPRDGESMDAAVLRECRAVRTGVGMQDATTLGKIEVQGPGAGEFLNRVYTNGFAKLAPGKARYGLMCTPDGMLFDDGVTLRIDTDRYFMTTTTGNAAQVLEWLEEWHQTEWSDLEVTFTSATEQWVTVAVAGPRSRDVIARVAPDLDVSREAFEFMEFRETVLASGIPARICRISFSGELAFEINVPTWYGASVWEDVYAAGAGFDITPYGTEAMHVLRAEKGFPIIGQDTDGTVTPQDAGMGWAVSKFKDFVGKRSYSRPDTAREDRKHLVSVLPTDPTRVLPEGTQLVAAGTPVDPVPDAAAPVPMVGHVTSSYMSAVLERSFGLALVENGRNLVGTTLHAPVGGDLLEVTIGETCLYDPEGARRDG
ncbi:2Fe-2S iron-sulfur cluster-binding protein [Brevibacterium litoralis]|uniref:2Fe-2S iron-sulfur cluster-binding protein n=1 Tax=Brevibacterium litoralis TaxID=3138935 RepID=UPI0032F05228